MRTSACCVPVNRTDDRTWPNGVGNCGTHLGVFQSGMIAANRANSPFIWTIFLVLGSVAPAHAGTFSWRGVSFTVPDAYKASDWNYGEGIVTTLAYEDGSRIILQQGFMMRKPLLQEGHDLVHSSETDDKFVREGLNTGAATYWREEDFKLRKARNKPSRTRIVLPTVAYDHVPESRKAEFDSALESFEQAMNSK